MRGSHVILSDALAVLAKLFASGDERHRLSPAVYKQAVARMLDLKVRGPSDKDPIPAKVNRAAYQRYRTVMKSRETAASLMPNDKVTISVDHWLEIVLDTVFVFLAEQEETLVQIFKRFDADGDGQLTLDEFMELTTSISPAPTSDKERRRQEGEAREAYSKMMHKSKDGVITPKVFAKEWRHHFLALEKAELHALTAEKREAEAGEAGADQGVVDGIDVDDGHGVYNWDRVLDECADAEWDLEQFCKEHAIPADNIFSAHASDILSEIRALVDTNSKATTPSDSDLGSCVHLLKRFKEARVKAERHVTRLQRVFNVARPGREGASLCACAASKARHHTTDCLSSVGVRAFRTRARFGAASCFQIQESHHEPETGRDANPRQVPSPRCLVLRLPVLLPCPPREADALYTRDPSCTIAGLIKDERPPATTEKVPTSHPVTLRHSGLVAPARCKPCIVTPL